MTNQSLSSNYPAMPPEQSPQRGPEPASVRTATRLMFLRAAIGLISLIAVFATKNTLKSKIRDNNPNYDAAKLNTVLNAAIVVAVVVGVIFLVLYILLALQVGKGKGWARVVTMVFAGLGILSAISSLVQTEPALTKVLAVVEALIDISVIVLLAQSQSSRYFTSSR